MGNVSGTEDGTTLATAFTIIQAGIDAAGAGDEVIVSPGTYVENLVFPGIDMVVRSTFPSDPLVVVSTIIDGGAAGSVVTFAGTETASSLLAGFTITNGNSAGNGGGILGNGALARIEDNVITANVAVASGGGLSDCDGTLQRNTISSNTAALNGGGLHECDGDILNNRVIDNTASTSTAKLGGGFYLCDGRIANNLISGNLVRDGGGLAFCQGLIESNLIVNNTATGGGGGLNNCDGVLQNNVIANNASLVNFGALWECDGQIINCTLANNTGYAIRGGSATIINGIIYGNTPGAFSGFTGTVTYSDVQGAPVAGTGNIDQDPLFVAPFLNDVRLRITSPARDAGTATGAPATDIDGTLRPQGAGVDMGAYEQRSAFWVDGSLPVSGDGTSRVTAFTTLQEGIDAAAATIESEVWVTAGTYGEARTSPNADGSGLDTGSLVMQPNVHLYGGFRGDETARTQRNPAANVTIIDGTFARGGQAAYHVIVGANNATLDGFTIMGGLANGGGASSKGAGLYNASASPTISNCHFINNTAVGDGGAMFNGSASSPVITNSVIANNNAANGGAIQNDAASSPVLINCTISANAGGAMDNVGNSFPVIVNSIFWNDTPSEIVNVDTSVSTVTYSIVQGGHAGTGNVNMDPLFVDPSLGNFSLQKLSPAIDTGTSTGAFGSAKLKGAIVLGCLGSKARSSPVSRLVLRSCKRLREKCV